MMLGIKHDGMPCYRYTVNYTDVWCQPVVNYFPITSCLDVFYSSQQFVNTNNI